MTTTIPATKVAEPILTDTRITDLETALRAAQATIGGLAMEVARLTVEAGKAAQHGPAAEKSGDLPETADQARDYLVQWHLANLPHPYFTDYINKYLAGDFAYHMARWLARRTAANCAAGQKGGAA